MLKVEVESHPSGNVVVRPRGRVDAESAPSLKLKLQEVAGSAPKIVVIDMGGVEFIDSSGLSSLVSGNKALRENGGSLILSRPNPQALTALRLTMLDRVFSIYPSVDEAFGQGDLLIP